MPEALPAADVLDRHFWAPSDLTVAADLGLRRPYDAAMVSYPSLGGVLAAAVACFVIGGFWFSPLLFADAWMRELHVGDEPGSRALGALLAVPQSLVAAFVLGVVLASAGVTDAGNGIVFGLLVWIGFCVALHLPAAYLERAPRRFAIDVGHKLAICVAMGAILGLVH